MPAKAGIHSRRPGLCVWIPARRNDNRGRAASAVSECRLYRSSQPTSVACKPVGDGLGLLLLGHGVGHQFAGERTELEAVAGAGVDDPQPLTALEDEAVVLRRRIEAAAHALQAIGAEIGDHAAQVAHDLIGLVPRKAAVAVGIAGATM